MHMADLPHPWGIYAQFQAALARCSSVDDVSWGLESGLDAICEGGQVNGVLTNSNAEDVRRSMATGARRERYRAALLQRHAVEQAGSDHWLARTTTDDRALIGVRSELRHLQRRLRPADLALLVQSARGVRTDELARRVGVSAAAVRARISRNRMLAAKVAQ
jgi:hypothetical protein